VSRTSVAELDPSGAQHFRAVTEAPQWLCIAAQHAFRVALTPAA
jgi:hypothetical protein